MAVLNALLLLALPLAVVVGGAWLMDRASRRRLVRERLDADAQPEDRRPLNQRLRGYDDKDAAKHWSPLRGHPAAARAELLFLKLDLVFPVAYGTAFTVALHFAWRALGHPFEWLWIAVPVAVTVVADWMENAIQISELSAFTNAQDPALHPGWIRLASMATQTKLVFFAGICALLLALVARLL